MREGQAVPFRRKGQAAGRGGCGGGLDLAFGRASPDVAPCRPGDRTGGMQSHGIDPAAAFLADERSRTIGGRGHHSTVVAARHDPDPVGGGGQDGGTRMRLDPAVLCIGKQDGTIAERQHGRGSQERHRRNMRTRLDGSDHVEQGGGWRRRSWWHAWSYAFFSRCGRRWPGNAGSDEANTALAAAYARSC